MRRSETPWSRGRSGRKRPSCPTIRKAIRRFCFGKKYAEAGVRSMAILPLIVADEAVGVLALYADESRILPRRRDEAADGTGRRHRVRDRSHRQAGTARLPRLLRCAHRTRESQPVSRAGGAVHAQRRQRRTQAGLVPDRSGAVQEHQRQPRPAGRRRAVAAGGGVADAQSRATPICWRGWMRTILPWCCRKSGRKATWRGCSRKRWKLFWSIRSA